MELVPDEKGEAENEKRLVAIGADKSLDKLLIHVQLRIEGEGRLGAELHHSQNAGAARREVGGFDHVLRVDRKKRHAAAAENGTERRDQSFGLTSRRLVIDDDAARSLSGGAARAHDHRRKQSALQLHFLEQA